MALPPLGRSDRIPPNWLEISAYGIPALAVAAPTFFVQFYFLSFATDVLLLAPATVAVILAAGRIWDAITDPLAGYWSDRTRSQWGRRKPWLLGAAPASAIAFVALWNPPAGLASPAAAAAWSAVWLFALTAATTAWSIPHQAQGAEWTHDTHTRHRIFGVRFVTAVTGAGLSFGGMQLVGNAVEPRAAAGSLAIVVAAVMSGLLLVPALALPNRPLAESSGPRTTPWQTTRAVLADRRARRLLSVWFFVQFGMASQGVIAPYMATYVLGRPEWIGVLPALFIGPLVGSVPVWIVLARRFGARRVWRGSMAAGAIAYAALFALPADDLAAVAILLGLAGFATGAAGPLGPAFFAGLADADALRSGERREGAFFAAKEFTEKASAATVALAVGAALQVSGFVPHASQEPSTLFAIRSCVSLLPGAALGIAAVLLGHRVDVSRVPSIAR